MIQTLQTRRSPRLLAWALSAALLMPVMLGLTGCGKGADTSQSGNATPNTPVASTMPGSSASTNPATGQTGAPPKQGMSNGKKAVIVLAGAALLYYLYKKHQAAQQAAAGTQGNSVQPQLYRSSNGGVYYRDPQNPQKVTWLTAPGQPVSVSAGDVQKYAPDYQQYQGQPAPAPPAGAATQSFSQYDPSATQ